MNCYVPESRLPGDAIQAGLNCGMLTPWRVDADGVQWFKFKPAMRGVPGDHFDTAGDDDDFATADDDDPDHIADADFEHLDGDDDFDDDQEGNY